ncbi:hypothetical protein Tco_0079535 [Tanacetum coccineum]
MFAMDELEVCFQMKGEVLIEKVIDMKELSLDNSPLAKYFLPQLITSPKFDVFESFDDENEVKIGSLVKKNDTHLPKLGVKAENKVKVGPLARIDDTRMVNLVVKDESGVKVESLSGSSPPFQGRLLYSFWHKTIFFSPCKPSRSETYVSASVKEIDYVQLGIVNQAELKLQPRAFFSFCTTAYTEVKIFLNLLRT